MGRLSLEGSSFTRAKPLLLLTYLAIEGATSRRELAALFYMGTKNPRDSLSSAIKQLRKENADLITADKTMLSSTVACDAVQLLEAINQADIQAIDYLYTGSFLQGNNLDLNTELEEWVYGIRDYLVLQVQTAYLKYADALAAKGEFRLAANEAEKVVKTPLDSIQPDALFHLHALLLAGDSTAVKKVHDESLAFSLSLHSSKLEAQNYLQSYLGSHLTVIPSFLSTSAASFIGRESELQELKDLIFKPDCYLLTILGWGGSGKTRLALKLAQDLTEYSGFENGVVFVSLEDIASVDLFAQSIANSLAIVLSGATQPIDQVIMYLKNKSLLLVLDNFEHLLEAVSQLEVILKNCPNIKILVTSRETLNLSQEWKYEVKGFRVPKLQDESLEAIVQEDALILFKQRAQQSDHRFGLNETNLASVLSILELLQGSPLGIELAASWIKILEPEEIAGEIANNLDILANQQQDTSRRQQSLRATFEYSWGKLSLREQAHLSQLSVFSGGFTRHAAQAVAGVSLTNLARLVDKSLIQHRNKGRFQSHPLLKQFAYEKLSLNQTKKLEAERKHARYYLENALKADAQLNGLKHSNGFTFFLNEINNLRLVLAWCLEHQEMAFGLVLVGHLGQFWLSHDDPTEALNWYEAYLKVDIPNELIAAKAAALGWAAGFYGYYQGDIDKGIKLFDESLALFENVDNKTARAKVHAFFGHMYTIHSHQLELGEVHFQQAIMLSQEEHDYSVLSLSLALFGQNLLMRGKISQAKMILESAYSNSANYAVRNAFAASAWCLGIIDLLEGEYADSRILVQQAIKTYKELNYPANVYFVSIVIGVIDMLESDISSAKVVFKEILDYLYEHVPPFITGAALDEIAYLAFVEKLDERAAQLGGMLNVLRSKWNIPPQVVFQNRLQIAQVKVKTRMSEKAFETAFQKGQKMSLKEAVAFALEGL